MERVGLRQPGPDDRSEMEKVVEVVLDHVPHYREIDITVAVNEDVSETNHVAEG